MAVALSPIYWPIDFRSGSGRPPESARAWAGRLSLAVRLGAASLAGRSHAAAQTVAASSRSLALAYESADVLLPNSELEAGDIAVELGVSTPMEVVPNAADSSVFYPPPNATTRTGVVMAARIEPLKNQLALIRACRRLRAPLTVVGAPHPHHPEYVRKCRDIADSSVTFVDHLPPAGLADLFRSSKVHALPSWFETTGLSSLEAALCGCSIVTTSRGYASEYFGDDAFYCDPGVPSSLDAALREALTTEPPAGLVGMIRSRNTWRTAAQATLRGYEVAIRQARHTALLP